MDHYFILCCKQIDRFPGSVVEEMPHLNHLKVIMPTVTAVDIRGVQLNDSPRSLSHMVHPKSVTSNPENSFDPSPV